jgi:uncharacterized membrane protein
MALIAFLLVRNKAYGWVLTSTAVWDAFAISLIATSWIVFFTRPVKEINFQANKEDGSRFFVLSSVIICSFAGLLMVMTLMTSKDRLPEQQTITSILSVVGMIFSWVMVHTLFTFHYAHLYYDGRKDDSPGGDALDFPGERTPDYLDFAYFSFVIGMTFQVSDVEISSRTIRRTALAHALLAFVLNTFVVALTVNSIAH